MATEFFLDDWLKQRGIDPDRVRPYDVRLGSHELGKPYKGNRVTHADLPGLTFVLDLAEGGGVLKFEARADRGSGQTVTHRALRRANLDSMALAIRAAWALDTEVSGMASTGMVEHYRGEIRKQETTGTRSLSDDELARAMKHYIHACQNGGSTREAAETFGCTKDQMDYYRKLAIKRGLFKPYGRQGRSGGFLLPRGEAALKESTNES